MEKRRTSHTQFDKPHGVVGRSAVTGRVVLTPASKVSAGALKRADAAVGQVLREKSKA